MSMQAGFRALRPHVGLLSILLLAAVQASAGVGNDWLPTVPPPPRNLDEALGLCGGGDSKTYDSDKDPWRRLEPQLEAQDQKLQAAIKAKAGGVSQQAPQDMAAQMLSQMADQMSDPNAVMANMQSTQAYSQYQASLGPASPDQAAQAAFGPAYKAGLGKVNAILKARDAKLEKCPLQHGEAGDFPLQSCADPIQAEAELKKAAAANAYLAEVNQAWPAYLSGVKDYFKKVEALPPGVDANNPQIKLTRQGIPGQELDGIKKMAEVTHNLCSNAVGLKSKYGPDG
jgi:hypothetical protein